MLKQTLQDKLGRKGKLRLLPLVMTIFFCVSGGPYGLEPVVQSGHGMALILIAVVPFIWAIPIALMSAELGSAIPEEGGYYEWVKRGVGERSAFWCAWLTYLYSCVDLAIYPVLFVSYLASLLPDSMLADPMVSFLVRLAMIAPLAWLNVRGAVSVGGAATFFAIMLLAPFAILVAQGLGASLELGAHLPLLASPGMTATSAFTAGLFVIMWNYLGWDSLSTIAREVEEPQKLFPRALMLAIPLVILCYFLPVYAGIGAMPDTSQWEEGSWTLVAQAIGGDWLATAIALGGLLSAAGLFASGLLAASRIPFVLASDHFMPQRLTKLHPQSGTPAIAIIISAFIYLVLSTFSFTALAEMDVILYSGALLFEFWALIRLRTKQPDLPRPFHIRGGMPVVIFVSLLPTLLILVASYQMLTEDPQSLATLVIISIVSGALLLGWKKRRMPVITTDS